MIVVRIQEVISKNLNSGETVETVKTRFVQTSQRFIYEYFWSYKKQHGLPATFGYDDLMRILKAKEKSKVKTDYWESIRKHYAGYLGDAAVHYLLGKDWHDVWKFNVHDAPHMPDGYINVRAEWITHEAFEVERLSYNVKIRYKNEWGLTVYRKNRSAKPDISELKEDFYVLGHYRARSPCIYLVGYVTRAELFAHSLNQYLDFATPREEVHPIEYFTPLKVFDGLEFYCSDRWNVVSKTLP